MHDEWRKIKDFDYEISTSGMVRRLSNGRPIKPTWGGISGDYRARVRLCKNGKVYRKIVSRLILETFVGPGDGKVACHNDGNPRNNVLSNLRWDSQSGNLSDRHKHGTDFVGERNPRSKINSEDVLRIKARLSDGESCSSIARDYPVTVALVCHIKNGRAWSHIK